MWNPLACGYVVAEMRLEGFLRKAFREGALEVALPGGRRIALGDGSAPSVVVRISSAAWAARIALNPEMAVGEAYMEGALQLERGDIYDLIDLAGRNFAWRPDLRRPGPFARWRHDLLQTRNARRQARRNVAHHYDLSLDLYRRFLDEDLQYSCAYFQHPGQSLEAAQQAKQRHIAAKLLVAPGSRVLDIGCGWGGLALRLAAETGARVDGITLSAAQLEHAQRRAEARGLAGRVRFSLTDYRDAGGAETAGAYDRIVSVGMFEHVGRPNYQAFFDKVAQLLTEDGVALIHAIGRSGGPSRTQPWIAKYIFPGGYIPALSEVLPAVERAGLVVADLETLRMHYAHTLRAWRERFAAARGDLVASHGERFCRMWEFYLAASETAFRHCGHFVFHLQLARRVDAVPTTRDYIAQAEQALGRASRSVA